MKKLNSIVVLIFLVSVNSWSQTIPQTLQGSWGANGSQAIRINADGSGEWGAGNLAQSATFRVAGNTLNVRAMNMDGQMQWRVDGNTLFLTNPTGFLGELLITVMKNGGVDRLTRMGSGVTSGNTANNQQYDSENDFRVTKLDNGKSIEISEYVGSKQTVSIPSHIQNLPVISIGDEAFMFRTNIAKVNIPNSVISIGNYAFAACTSLTSVTIPNSVTSIGNNAFEGCTSLTSVTIGNSVTSIGDSTFIRCTSLTSITIPSSVTSIGQRTFMNCKLTSVTIPNSLASIGYWAFFDCTSLTSVTFQGTIAANKLGTNNPSGNMISPFDGDLQDKYLAGGIGRYTRPSGGTTWTKQ